MAANERRRNLHVARMLQAVALAVAFVLLLLPDLIAALKDVSVTIPQAVKRGSNALLVCNYDMENDTLYSVKWYKGRREFYRYTPKENPAMKVFPLTSGLDVERNLSNQSHVVLLSVALNVSGKFTCEISVEAPSFQTAMVSGEMEVVELPEQQATVTGIQPRYRIGDLVDGNCSIKFSKPAANLTWTINGIVVPPHHIKTYQIEKYDEHNLESVMSAINFMVTTQHFHKGQMKLKCTASIFNIYKEEIENVIEEDRPRIMASGRSYDMNAYPYDQHSSGDGFEDHNESYLTYYSAADMASSSAPRARSRYVELLRQWHRYWTNLLASASSSPKPAPSSGKEQTVVEDPAATTTETGSSNNTNVAASSLSSIKGNVKRFVDDISRRFKTQIENTMASMTPTVGPSRALMEESGPSGPVPRRQEMEINTRRARRRGVSCKSSRSLALALATADVDDDEAGDTVDDDRWRPRRCTRNALLIAAVVLGVGCAGLSLVLLLGDLVAERPVKVMAADGAERGGRRKEAAAARVKELMKEDSRSCQNKARVRTAAKWQRETAPIPASASSWARALAWDPAAGAAAGAGRGPAVGPVDGFNDFLSRDHEYTLQEIQAMKSFYNCHGSNESGAETEAKCRRRDLRTLAKEAMTTTSTRTTTALTTSQSEDEAKEMKKNCHYALACQRQLSMMLLPSNNGEKYRNRNFAWSDDVADADADAVLTTMDCERVTKEELEVGGGRGGGGGGSRSLPVDGQVSKLPIMLRQRQRGRAQGGCQQC